MLQSISTIADLHAAHGTPSCKHCGSYRAFLIEKVYCTQIQSTKTNVSLLYTCALLSNSIVLVEDHFIIIMQWQSNNALPYLVMIPLSSSIKRGEIGRIYFRKSKLQNMYCT